MNILFCVTQLRITRLNFKCHGYLRYIWYDGYIRNWESGVLIGCYMDFSFKLGKVGPNWGLSDPACLLLSQERSAGWITHRMEPHLLQGYNPTISQRSGDIGDSNFQPIWSHFQFNQRIQESTNLFWPIWFHPSFIHSFNLPTFQLLDPFWIHIYNLVSLQFSRKGQFNFW